MSNRTAHKYALQRDQAEIERNEMARTLARLREDIGIKRAAQSERESQEQ